MMKIVRFVCCSCLLLVSLLAISPPGAVLAQEGEPPEEKIEIDLTYPKLEAIAGGAFEFEVEFKYTGAEPRDFQLRAIAPQGWEVFMTPQFQKEKKLSAIRLKSTFSFGDKIRVVATAPFWPLPDPGEYLITLEAASDELSTTIDLTAVITARYSLFVVPAEERYNTKATVGKDNFFSIKVQNWSTAVVEDINFSTTKPEGWIIEFTPNKIETINALAIQGQTVDVNIKPPSRTIAGDYNITIRASGKQATAGEIQIRVTVESPTIWGWVGVAIILLVVIGVVVIFMRFSRR